MANLRSVCLIFLILVLTSCTQPLDPRAQEAQVLHLTGFLEAYSVDIAPEIGGRLLEISVNEGDWIEAGQVLARLDDSLIQSQLKLADADIAEKKAQLDQLKTTVRLVDVARAEAQVNAAEVTLEAAESALVDAFRLRDNPQTLDLEIAQAENALPEAIAHAQAAQFLAEAEDINVQMWEAITRDLWAGVDVQLPGGGSVHVGAPRDKIDYANREWNLAGQTAWAAWQDAEAAEAAVNQARITLADLRRAKANPQVAEARVIVATNARDMAAAAFVQARAMLTAVRSGPSKVQITAAEAVVDQAQAARDALASELDYTLLLAPANGMISARYFAEGEVVGANQAVFTAHQPNTLSLTIYVPASLTGEFQPGDDFSVEVDGAPDQRFNATVLAIGDEPEYTLQQAQNVAERAGRVYAVKLRLGDSDPRLRPGLPAHVSLTVNP